MRPSRAQLPIPAQLVNIRRVMMGVSFGTNSTNPQSSANSDLGKNIQGWDSGNIVTPGANVAFTVPHNLGYVPTRF